MKENIMIVWTVASFMGLLMSFQAKKREDSGMSFGPFEQGMMLTSSIFLGAFGVVVGIKFLKLEVSPKFVMVNMLLLTAQLFLFIIFMT